MPETTQKKTVEADFSKEKSEVRSSNGRVHHGTRNIFVRKTDFIREIKQNHVEEYVMVKKQDATTNKTQFYYTFEKQIRQAFV